MIKPLLWVIALASCHSAFAADVTFADGKVQVPLPDRFTVSQRNERLVATFGAGDSFRLEMSLVRVFDNPETHPAFHFVDQQSLQQGGLAVRSDRFLFMANERQLEGDGFRTMHWQIGLGACVLEMSVTRPAPMSQEAYDALGRDLNAILRGVKCSAMTASPK